ncbi:MAG: RNA-binding protein [Gammaproteobacteria bacterium]|nr:RNA-binding protein [Gammaproteobacteria bacterium]
MNIYVGNLPYKMGDEELRALFTPFGSVQSAQVIVDRRSGRSRGYGFVEMADAAEGERAIAQLNGSEIQGRALRISISSPAGSPASRGGKPAQKRAKSGIATPARSAPDTTPKQKPGDGSGLFGFIRKLFG